MSINEEYKEKYRYKYKDKDRPSSKKIRSLEPWNHVFDGLYLDIFMDEQYLL